MQVIHPSHDQLLSERSERIMSIGWPFLVLPELFGTFWIHLSAVLLLPVSVTVHTESVLNNQGNLSQVKHFSMNFSTDC